MMSYYPETKAKPILSGKSAPGLIISSGIIGPSMKGHTGLFVSSNGGMTWNQVCNE